MAPLAEPAVDIATIAAEITAPAERTNPNVVKAVFAPNPESGIGRALYFPRAAAPAGDGPLYHHIGLYAYRRETLARFVAVPPARLALRERPEQSRSLEPGTRLTSALALPPPHSAA